MSMTIGLRWVVIALLLVAVVLLLVIAFVWAWWIGRKREPRGFDVMFTGDQSVARSEDENPPRV